MYLKENSKIKDKFFKKILTQKMNKKNSFFGSKIGGRLIHPDGIHLYTGKYSKVSCNKKENLYIKMWNENPKLKNITSTNERVLWQYTHAVLALSLLCLMFFLHLPCCASSALWLRDAQSWSSTAFLSHLL